MTPHSAVLSSRLSAPVENTPCPETVQEIRDLTELLRLADGLPTEYQTDFYKILDRLTACVERRQRMLGYVQDALSQMSLDLKYLVFDLEVTRRERDEYRNRLDASMS